MKIVRVFLKPGNLGFIDVTPPVGQEFSFPTFVTSVMSLGLLNESCWIPPASVQCMLYNEPDKIMLTNAALTEGRTLPTAEIDTRSAEKLN